MERLLLRVPEGAEMLGFSKSKTYELINTGELPAIKIGNVIRIPADELREWVKKRVEEARSEP